MSLDFRELGRVLGSAGLRGRRRSLAWTGAVRRFARGPRRVIVLADLLLLVRTPRLLGQVAVAALLGGESAKLSDDQLQRIADMIEKARREGTK